MAEFTCYLSTGMDAVAAALAAESPGQVTIPKTPEFSTSALHLPVQGRLYVTSNCLCYTTIFNGDSKDSKDTTFVLLRSQVHAVNCSAPSQVLQGSLVSYVILTTDTREMYCLTGEEKLQKFEVLAG
jgi:hypothetical protein